MVVLTNSLSNIYRLPNLTFLRLSVVLIAQMADFAKYVLYEKKTFDGHSKTLKLSLFKFTHRVRAYQKLTCSKR